MTRDIDITRSRWGDATFLSRYRHFVHLTNPSYNFKSSLQLDQAKQITHQYRADGVLPGGGKDTLWAAKYLHDSAYHPESGEKQALVGRMSFQVPGGMLTTGILLAFYRSPLEVFLGQWFNQSFNAIVNFTNRSGDKPLPNSLIITAYLAATSFATATSIGLNKGLAARAPPLVTRFVPFIAVAAANMVNIPLMRSQELREGVVVVDEEGNKLGTSTVAARRAIATVTFSRVCMAAPGMLLTPVLMEYLEKKPRFRNMSHLSSLGVQTLSVGVFLVVMVPAACALFPQKRRIAVSSLERELGERIRERNPGIETVFYNKGL